MKKESVPARRARDPFALLREMTSEFDRMFNEPGLRWPLLRTAPVREPMEWSPAIDVFEKDNRLVTRVDLPGMKKEDVKVEVSDGTLTISGQRKSEVEEKKEDYYRCERQYGSFYRAVPLPEGVKLEDIKAAFTDGVLEVSVPLPVETKAEPRTIQIEEPTKSQKSAA